MNTFLPHSDFAASARCLDYRRLGKQRVEAMQIIAAITGRRLTIAGWGAERHSGWRNHPACKMWAGYVPALARYGQACATEYRQRGYQDRTANVFADLLGVDELMPPWLGNALLHATHRANLLRKDPVYYGQFGWTEVPAEGYWWPT